MTQADARLPALPLLRRLRLGLRHRVVLQLGGSPAAVRARDRPPRDPIERRRGADPGRRQGAGEGRAVLRSRDAAPSSRCSARSSCVGASTVDSTRILLNSTSDRYPNGLGNGSDVIGRYLCEQIRFHARGILPELVGTATRNDRGIGGEHVYMPRFNHRAGRKRDYLRGFGAQFWNTGASAGGAHGGSELIPGFGAVAQDARSSGGTRPGSRSIHTAKCCRTRTTASPSIRIARTATACRCRRSTTASARTSGRWPST